MTRKILLISVILLCSMSQIMAQDDAPKNPVLTNDAVIEMVKTGISDVVIIAKINSSEVKFDTSNAALVKLKESGVSDNVQAAMIVRLSARENEIKKENIVEITLAAPEIGSIDELAGKTKVYFYTSDTRARELMAKELAKYPVLEVVDKIEKSDFILVYEVTGTFCSGFFCGDIGDLYAVTLGSKDAQGKTHVRIHYSVRRSRKGLAEKNSAEATVQRFLIEFKKMQSKADSK